MKSPIKRRQFDLQQHQNFLLSQKQLQIKQFQNVLSYKLIDTITYEEGSVFRGQVSTDGLRNGIGMLLSSDGSVYLGRWKNDLYHGQGIYIYGNGQRYQGEIIQNMKQGKGKMYYINGDIYEGMWEQDQREGMGQIIFANGDRYVGLWKGGEQQGQGEHYSGVKLIASGLWHNSKFIEGKIYTAEYQGSFKNSTPHGEGIYKYQDGSVYRGTFKNGEKQGKGRYQFINGDVYEGNFRCGLKHGKGIYRYTTGDIFDGEYYNDYKCGYGTLKFSNGDQYRGEWDKDLFHGIGSYTFSTKQILNGKFSFGVLVNQQQAVKQAFRKGIGRPINQKMIQSLSYVYTPVKIEKDYRMMSGGNLNLNKYNSYANISSFSLKNQSKLSGSNRSFK